MKYRIYDRNFAVESNIPPLLLDTAMTVAQEMSRSSDKKTPSIMMVINETENGMGNIIHSFHFDGMTYVMKED